MHTCMHAYIHTYIHTEREYIEIAAGLQVPAEEGALAADLLRAALKPGVGTIIC